MTGEIILVEDNQDIREALREYLIIEGYTVKEFSGVKGVSQELKQQRGDLVILDLMLPDGSGFNLLKEIRSIRGIPVLILSAKDTESDRITGFELGADDYVVKPFSPREIVLRVGALLRRGGGSEFETKRGRDEASIIEITVRGTTIVQDLDAHSLMVNGELVEVTAAEWEILGLLLSSPGRVFSREQILDRCLGYSLAGTTRTVDTHISNLRTKLGGDGCIRTHRGYGYAIHPDPSSSA